MGELIGSTWAYEYEWPVTLDAADLFERHTFDSPRVDAWLDYLSCDPVAVRSKARLGEARGEFTGNMRAGTPSWNFLPRTDGPDRAILIAVNEAGSTVDCVAVSKLSTNVWGVVSGGARAAGFDEIGSSDEPLRVHENAWSWLLDGCTGVLPLRAEVWPELARAKALLAANWDHAEEISWRAFEGPVFYRTGRTATEVLNAELASLERIFCDDVDPEEMAIRASARALAAARRINARAAV